MNQTYLVDAYDRRLPGDPWAQLRDPWARTDPAAATIPTDHPQLKAERRRTTNIIDSNRTLREQNRALAGALDNALSYITEVETPPQAAADPTPHVDVIRMPPPRVVTITQRR